MVKAVFLFLAIATFARAIEAPFYTIDATCDQIENLLSSKEKGAYFCFSDFDLEIALGKIGDLGDQVEINSLLKLNLPNVLKANSFSYRAIYGHRAENSWAAKVFKKCAHTWEKPFEPLSAAFLSNPRKNRCIQFLKQLHAYPLILIADYEVPLATRQLLFGPKCRFVSSFAINQIQIIEYTVLLVADSKFILSALFSQFEQIFVVDLEALKEPLCFWDTKDWEVWIGDLRLL